MIYSFLPLLMLLILINYLFAKLIQYLYNELYPKLKGFTREEKDKVNLLESIFLIIIFEGILNISKKIILCFIHGKCN